MKEECRTSDEIVRKIKLYESRIKALRKEYIHTLHGKYIQVEENLLFWAKNLQPTMDGVSLSGISIQFNENSFIVDNEDNYIVEDITSIKEIAVNTFYSFIKQGLTFVHDEFLNTLSTQLLTKSDDDLINTYFQIDNKDYFWVQKLAKPIRPTKLGKSVSGLNLTIYSESVFFCKENVLLQPTEFPRTTMEEFRKRVVDAIKIITDPIPEMYKHLIVE